MRVYQKALCKNLWAVERKKQEGGEGRGYGIIMAGTEFRGTKAIGSQFPEEYARVW